MKLLVTGGAGFIGSNFIHYWLQQYPNDSIINFDKLTYAGNLENLQAVENHPNYRFVQGDICDATVVNPLVHEVDQIVHFAAESHVDRSIAEPSPFIRTNVLGTQVLLQAALEFETRFHHVSTDEVFGSLPLTGQATFNETTPYQPRSPYSASKAGADHIVRAYWHTYGLPVTISNCSNNYGPWHFPEKMIPLAITQLLNDQPIPIYGDGRHVRDWLYVEDHCRALDAIIQAGHSGETYCIGGGEQWSNVTVARELIHLLHKDESLITFVADRPGHDERYAMDYSKIQRQLGWTPRVTVTNGLAQTVQWFQQHRQWLDHCVQKTHGTQ
ncbi:MAG: dTDP-glucose 4,6-dehydratase [Candidatus Kerfeldbacteria bacterium]|nr:dTDP-glucose 4,6-dehydratase [Candidatus Kerfeldbacteria bacterium]